MYIDGSSAIRHVFMVNRPNMFFFLFAEEVDDHEFAILDVEGDNCMVVDHGEGVEGVIGAILEKFTAISIDVNDGFRFAGIEDFKHDVGAVEGRHHF